MSLHDYKVSIEVEAAGYPFYSLIMAAMRQADSDNINYLITAFPEVWDELYERYYAAGGCITQEEIDRLHAELDAGAVSDAGNEEIS